MTSDIFILVLIIVILGIGVYGIRKTFRETSSREKQERLEAPQREQDETDEYVKLIGFVRDEHDLDNLKKPRRRVE